MTKQINIKLSDETSERLEALANLTGRTKTFYATEAIEAHLDDLEDYYVAKHALEEFRQSDDEPVAHEDVDWDALGR